MPDELTPVERRRLQLFKAALIFSIASAVVGGAAFVAALGFDASGTWKSVLAFIVVESMTSAAVLGAFARCPHCRARLGAASRGLLPASCPRCAVRLG